jgi:hypothetical protein
MISIPARSKASTPALVAIMQPERAISQALFKDSRCVVGDSNASCFQSRAPGIYALGSRHAQCLHRRRHRIGEEHGVNPLHDVAGNLEKVPFVFQRDQCLTCAVVHRNLQRLG